MSMDYEDDYDMEELIMSGPMKKGVKATMSMPMKKTKLADLMEGLERFALKAANCRATSADAKSQVKEHVRMIREILAGEYTK